jgi:hypothetical protein
MELKRVDWVWLRTLSGELEAASRGSRGGRVFFDQEWIDEVVAGLRAITDGMEKPKKG